MKRVLFFIFLAYAVSILTAQTPVPSSADYDDYKRSSVYEAPRSLVDPESPILFDRQARNGLLVPLDESFVLAMNPNDDGYAGPFNLPFTFYLYNTPHNSFFINNNGNISFGSGYSHYTASGFPISSFPMLAAFWADVDTRGTGSVWYRVSEHQVVVTWYQVGYFNAQTDKINTFQVIFSDGLDPTISIGVNVAFSYAEMQWTTGSASGGSGGFGGTPATVGVNKGDGVEYALIGRFNQPGNAYDGPGGNPDGVDYLDNQLFLFNTGTNTNLPPVFDTHPGALSLNIGSTLNRTITAIGPESNQTVTAMVTTSIPSGFAYNVTSGNPCIVNFEIQGNIENVGDHWIQVVATDNGYPVQSSSTYIDVSIINTAPIIVSIPPDSTLEDELFSYPIIVEDPDFAFGDYIGFEGFVSGPEGLSVILIDGVYYIQWTPENADVGVHEIGFGVHDLFGASDYQWFSLTVENVNDPPEIYLPQELGFWQGDSYWYYIRNTYYDIDSDDLSLSFSGNSNISVELSGDYAVFSSQNWSGTENITFTVTDDEGLSASDTIAITVIPPKTCYDLNYTSNPSGDSPYQWQYVAVQGVVTAIDAQNDIFFISDPSGGAYSGLMIYSPFIPSVGSYILTKGYLSEVAGTTTLSSLNYIHVLQQNYPLPTPSIVAPENIFMEAWESCLIMVENLVCRTPLGSPDIFEAQKGIASVMVSDRLYHSGHVWNNVGYGQSFDSITGIMDHYGYEAHLLPRNDADLAFSEYYTCAQIQYHAPGNTDSPYLGAVVTVQGIITARPENRMIMWIGDPEGGPWSGLLIHTGITTGQIGDLVQITGTVAEYYGQTELDFVTSIQVIAANQQLPPPWQVNLVELQGYYAERYEGVLVTIQKTTIVDSPINSYIFEVSDNNSTIQVSNRLYPLGTQWEHMDPGKDFREITGILDYYQDTYRVCPRNDDDIIELKEYVWICNYNQDHLQFVDTRDNQVFGPFLHNQVGDTQWMGITVSPDNSFMLLTSFNDHRVYHVNIENPFYPWVVTSYNLGWAVEDIAISQDGRYAVISDGGGAQYIGLIDLQSRAVVQTISIAPRQAQSIEIGPDGKVLVGDYNNARVYQYILDYETGSLSDSGVNIGFTSSPFNIAISPDGSHALIALSGYSAVIKLHEDNALSLIQTLPIGSAQSAIYSPDGLKAFVYMISPYPSQVYAYNVNTDGSLQLISTYTVDTGSGGGFYGLDVLASNIDGSRIYASHPSTPTHQYLFVINTENSDIQSINAYSPASIHISNLPLKAFFAAAQTNVEAGSALKFTQFATGGPQNFYWDFGDGSFSTERHPEHIYTAPGTYTVSLQVQRGSVVSTIVKEAYIEVFTNINASIRYLDAEFATYLPGDEMGIVLEVDTALNSQTIWIDVSLLSAEGSVIAQVATSHVIQALADDPCSLLITIPAQTAPGLYEILAVVYDISGSVEQDRMSINIEVLNPVPILWTNPEFVSFGECFITDMHQISISLGNSGYSVLNVAALNIAASGFSVNPTDFSIQPGDSLEIQVTYTPTQTGQVNSVLTGTTNIPSLPNISIPVSAMAILYPSPVYHSVSPNPLTPEYLSELGVLVSISFADTMIVDASSIQYRYDKNGNGVYDAAEVWQSVSAGEDATEITVQQLLSFRRDGDNFRYEFRAQNMRHSGYTYTGFQSAEGIADDFYVMIDATPPLWIDEFLVTDVGDNSVSLSWSESFDHRFAGYEIYYSTQPYLDDSDICWNFLNDPALTQLSTTQTVVTGLNPGTTYYFAIRARDTLNNLSEFSDEVSATTTGLTTSIALHIQLSGGVGMLSWDAFPGASVYNVYKASSPQGPWQSIGQSSNTQYEIELTDDKAFFNIRAVTPPTKASQGERK